MTIVAKKKNLYFKKAFRKREIRKRMETSIRMVKRLLHVKFVHQKKKIKNKTSMHGDVV